MKSFKRVQRYSRRILPFAVHIKTRYKDILWLSFAVLALPFQLRKINGQDVFEILRPLRLIILVVLAGFFAFVLVPQGQHAMKVLHNLKNI